MFKKMTNEIYLSFHNKFFDKIIKKKKIRNSSNNKRGIKRNTLLGLSRYWHYS